MIYSPFKAARHEVRIQKLRCGELILPTHVQIDVTNRCNHRCVYCFYRVAKTTTLNALFNEGDSIPKEKILSLLSELKTLGIPAIQYTGGGEPLIHPDFFTILDKTIKLGFEYALVTNGTLLTERWLPLLKHAAWIRISLDAATPETYSLTQGTNGNDFNWAMDALKMLTDTCKDIVLGVSYVINPINFREILMATELAKSLGIQNIRLSIAYTPEQAELFKNNWEEIEKLAIEAMKLEDQKFKVFNLVSAHLETLQYKKKGYNLCGYQHFTTAIGADGIVYPCCTLKYNPVSALGSIYDRTFIEIWQGERRKNWLKSNYLKYVCDKNPCWMDRKNQFISYLVDPEAKHKNFV